MFDIFALKVLVSVGVVIGLTLIAEKMSTRFAGILMSYPLGTAIILFFIGIEKGTVFAINSSLWAINGLVAETIFIYSYYLGVLYFKKHEVIGSVFLALIGFFASAFIIRQLPLNTVIISTLFLLTFVILSILLYREIKITNITNPVKTSKYTVLLRAISTTIVVLIVTGISGIIGVEWSGILSSFPTNIVVVLVIIHLSYRKKHVLTLIKGYPIGLIGLLIYLISIPLTYSHFGVYFGTLVSYGIATLYLVLYEFTIKDKLKAFL